MIFRIILILIVPLLSIIFSLMSSGIENLITADNKDWKTIPIYYWLSFWAIACFLFYRFKFSSVKKLKIYILRLIISLKVKFFQIDFIDKSTNLNDMQRKAMAIWTNLLSDTKSEMSCCMLSNRRMITKKETTCIISTQNDANCMYISKVGNNSIYYDVWLPNHVIAEMYKSFDKENKIRFQRAVDEARTAISSTMDL